jgi:hypothetical protein
MGCAARNKNFLDLQIAPLIWKRIVRQEISLDDVRDIDLNSYNQYLWLKTRRDLNEQSFSMGYSDLYFCTTSKGGSMVELHTNGASQRVNWGCDIDLYCAELCEYWLDREFRCVCELVRAGIETQIPGPALSLLRWEELEEMVCGSPLIDVVLLQSATEYERGCSATDPHIIW